MKGSDAWRAATSSRATMTILVMLGALLLLNVVVPQVAVVGREAIERAASAGPVTRFFLVHLHLSELSTSPIFLLTLGAFFLNLALVLIDRTHSTFKRLRFVPPTEAQVRTMVDAKTAVSFPLPERWAGHRAETVFARLGYRTTRPGEHSVWALRHPTAILGFPLFHLSFFVLCAGALSLYFSRFVATHVVTEGQVFETTAGRVVRRPPRGPPPGQLIRVEEVDTELVGGRPVRLRATLRRVDPPEAEAQSSEVNHPAEWGSISVLVERAGLSPVLWLQDERGFTLDRVAAPAIFVDGVASRTPLADGAWSVEAAPVVVGADFPRRDALPTTPVGLVVRKGKDVVFEGALKPGERVPVGAGSLTLEEVRYWVSVRVVDETGGLLLVIGFVMAVVGLTWRLVWFRREVGLWWDDSRLVLVARVEYFPRQFREELEALHGFLVAHPEPQEEKKEEARGP